MGLDEEGEARCRRAAAGRARMSSRIGGQQEGGEREVRGGGGGRKRSRGIREISSCCEMVRPPTLSARKSGGDRIEEIVFVRWLTGKSYLPLYLPSYRQEKFVSKEAPLRRPPYTQEDLSTAWCAASAGS